MGDTKPNYRGHRQRLRQRFLDHGLESFADYEALELLLTLFVPRRDVKPAAKRLAEQFGGIRGTLDASIEELAKVRGLGEVSAAKLKVVQALVVRYLKEKAYSSDPSLSLADLRDYCRASLGSLPVETFRVFYLDSGMRILGEEDLQRGTVNRATVYPRTVIDSAIRHKASNLLLAHNHPNDNPIPSERDKTITEAIELAGMNLDIYVIDHLIVTKDKVLSFRETGLL